MAEMAEYRFRAAKTFEQEEKCVASAIPKSTQYKNKWAVGIFEQWQKVRVPKVATLEPGGLFKNYDLHKVQSLEFPLLEMDALSLNIGWQSLSKKLLNHQRKDTHPEPYIRLCAEYVDSWRKRMQTWISISSMHQTKGAVVLLSLS